MNFRASSHAQHPGDVGDQLPHPLAADHVRQPSQVHA
jgi:hypothetical protein